MKIIGVIMEVNPFHNGHKYFLEQIDKNVDDILICITSTSITQRGELSVLNKHDKARLLLDNRVDLVIELPSVFANQGGLYFAHHAIEYLEKFGITHLYFGSETNNLNQLLEIVNSDITQLDFKNGIYKKELSDLKSNDILGISYLKSIKNKNIKPVLIKRIANNYNDSNITGLISSATSIRNNLDDENTKNCLPTYSYNNIQSINQELLFNIFKVNLQNCINLDIKILLSENNQLLYKMQKVLTNNNFDNINDFINFACDKNNSKYKLQRIIINVILMAKECDYPKEYIKVLGFNKRVTPLLKMNDITTSLKNVNCRTAEYEKRATNLFNIVSNQNILHDYEKPVIKNGIINITEVS